MRVAFFCCQQTGAGVGGTTRQTFRELVFFLFAIGVLAALSVLAAFSVVAVVPFVLLAAFGGPTVFRSGFLITGLASPVLTFQQCLVKRFFKRILPLFLAHAVASIPSNSTSTSTSTASPTLTQYTGARFYFPRTVASVAGVKVVVLRVVIRVAPPQRHARHSVRRQVHVEQQLVLIVFVAFVVQVEHQQQNRRGKKIASYNVDCQSDPSLFTMQSMLQGA